MKTHSRFEIGPLGFAILRRRSFIHRLFHFPFSFFHSGPRLFQRIAGVSLAIGFAAAATAEPVNHATNDVQNVIVVLGAAGAEEFEGPFRQAVRDWEKVCLEAGSGMAFVGLETNTVTTDFDRLKSLLGAEDKTSRNELWIVLLGHGTFDGQGAKFNLRGPDVSASDLADWLLPFQRPIILINGASSSGPFINKLSAPGRVIVTGTKSGHEQNYARFGLYFAQAVGAFEADLDKDGQTSVLEAFLFASRKVAEFYQTEGRLATEHALLDDNGDGLGTPADWYRGVRAIKKSESGSRPDGVRAHQVHLIRSAIERELSPEQRQERNDLELAIFALRESKETRTEDEYYQMLEPLLVELARLYESFEAQKAKTPASFE